MRRLILFRHAKAEARPPGKDDIDRTLTARGRRDSTVVGRVLAEAGLSPDLALVSPSARTRETWDQARAAFPLAQVRFRDALYNAAPEEVVEEVHLAADEAGTLMVVGHNPSLQELAVNLLFDGGAAPADIERVAARFPTATAVVFLIDKAGRASFDGLFHPRDHGEDDGASTAGDTV
jgi:phosphohistidine phosphatase